MNSHEKHDLAELIRNNRLRDELIPIKRLPDLIPSSRAGARLALPTIYRWILKGKLKSRKIGGSLFVTVDDLVEFISTRSISTEAARARSNTQVERRRGRAKTCLASSAACDPLLPPRLNPAPRS